MSRSGSSGSRSGSRCRCRSPSRRSCSCCSRRPSSSVKDSKSEPDVPQVAGSGARLQTARGPDAPVVTPDEPRGLRARERRERSCRGGGAGPTMNCQAARRGGDDPGAARSAAASEAAGQRTTSPSRPSTGASTSGSSSCARARRRPVVTWADTFVPRARSVNRILFDRQSAAVLRLPHRGRAGCQRASSRSRSAALPQGGGEAPAARRVLPDMSRSDEARGGDPAVPRVADGGRRSRADRRPSPEPGHGGDASSTSFRSRRGPSPPSR